MTLSFWLDPASTLTAQLQGDMCCDVAVVGAGLCGSAATLALAKAGVNVMLVEGNRVAGRATGRNAGFILQGTAERYNRAIAVMGRDRARVIHEWSLVNHDRMASVIAEEQIDCDYKRGGSLQLAGSPEEEAELVESATLLKDDGFDARVVKSQDLGDIYEQAGFHMGVMLPQDGELHPARFVRGAVIAAQRYGATVVENTMVTSMDASSLGDVRLHTQNGEIRCQIVLVCTNARIAQLLPWYADKVDPVRGQMLATAPAKRVFEWPIYADHGFDYWRQDPCGRVILGGWRNLDPQAEVGFNDALHPQIQQNMTDFIHRFDALKDIPITHRWSGIMGFSKDGLPMVGPAPGASGALAAAGFTGHGFGFAWLAGEALANVVLDGQHPFIEHVSPKRMLS